MVERSDKMWSTGQGNGKPLQYSCLENLINSMGRQKDTKLEDERLRLEGVQYATREELRAITNSSSKNVAAGPKREQYSAVVVSGGENNVQYYK